MFVSTVSAVLFTCAIAAGVHAGDATNENEDVEPIRVLLFSGANNHDWQWTTPSLERMLEATGRFAVDVTDQPAATLLDVDALRRYAVFVLDYHGPDWGEPARTHFLQAVKAGTGVVVVHAANNAFPGWVEYERMVGLCWRDGTGHGRFHPFDVVVHDHDHPITHQLPDLVAHPDELYHRLVHMHDAEFQVLATAYSAPETGGTGQNEPMILVSQYGAGRIFHTPLGHVWRNVGPSRASHEDPQFQRLIVRGTEWAATGSVTPDEPAPNTLSEEERAAGFRLLFDGQSTSGWRSFRGSDFPAQGWVVEDGCLRVVSGAGGGDVVCAETFADFEFRFQWRVAPGANSGVMIRVSEEPDATWYSGPEYQVLDDSAHAPGENTLTSAAALYGLYVAESANPFPAGQFNRSRIVARGDHVEHWLNGRLVVEAEIGSEDWNRRLAASKFASMPAFARSSRGHIALQDHGDDVWYRDLKIRPLESERGSDETR